MSRLIIRARWFFPVTSPLIENGLLTVQDGIIESIETAGVHATSDVDYADAVVLPGLINAHTHLELTTFRCCAPYMGSFADWLRTIVALQTADGAEQSLADGMRDGLAESLPCGVTTIADVGCGERAAAAWGTTRPNIAGFFEAIGMGPRRFDDHPHSIRRETEWCEQVHRTRSRQACGACRESRVYLASLSPHAPYSTAPEVYRQAIEYCRGRNLPICTHLAETPEELEFLARGTGPFRVLLEHRGLWDGSFEPPGCSPVQYAERLGLLELRPILAHVNYVSDPEISLLARRQAHVVYCPRTHRFFEHAPHRYGDMLAAGVNVCLGTDSPTSAPDLSILGELRFLRQVGAPFPAGELLEMATIRAARALGLESQLGSLEPGKRADFVVIPLESPGTNSPLQDLLEAGTVPAGVYLGGAPAGAG